jgi:hypothetical protein
MIRIADFPGELRLQLWDGGAGEHRSLTIEHEHFGPEFFLGGVLHGEGDGGPGRRSASRELPGFFV